MKEIHIVTKFIIGALMFLLMVSVSFALDETGLKNSWRMDTTNKGFDSNGMFNLTDNSFNITGKIGSGSYLSESNNYYLSGSNFPQPTSEYTLTFWITNNLSDKSSTTRYRLIDDGTIGIILSYRGSDDKLGVYHENTVGWIESDALSIEDGLFHFIGISWDGSYLWYYVDGVNAGNLSLSQAISAPVNMYIGRTTSGTSEWTGVIDELTVWDRALSPSELGEIYNSGSGLQLPVIIPSNFSNFSVFAFDSINESDLINNFSISINGSNYSTTNGNITTNIYKNESLNFNIYVFEAINDNGSLYNNKTFNNINLLNDYGLNLTLYTPPQPSGNDAIFNIDYNTETKTTVFLLVAFLFMVYVFSYIFVIKSLMTLSSIFIMIIGFATLFSGWIYLIVFPILFIGLILLFVPEKESRK